MRFLIAALIVCSSSFAAEAQLDPTRIWGLYNGRCIAEGSQGPSCHDREREAVRLRKQGYCFVGGYWKDGSECSKKQAAPSAAPQAPAARIERPQVVEPARPAQRTQSPAQPKLANTQPARPDVQIERWFALNTICRGAAGAESAKACVELENVTAALDKSGWCYGRKNQPTVDFRWHGCTSDSLRIAQITCRGRVSTGTLDSRVGECGFLTSSPVADKILATCKMGDECEVIGKGSKYWLDTVSTVKLISGSGASVNTPLQSSLSSNAAAQLSKESIQSEIPSEWHGRYAQLDHAYEPHNRTCDYHGLKITKTLVSDDDTENKGITKVKTEGNTLFIYTRWVGNTEQRFSGPIKLTKSAGTIVFSVTHRGRNLKIGTYTTKSCN